MGFWSSFSEDEARKKKEGPPPAPGTPKQQTLGGGLQPAAQTGGGFTLGGNIQAGNSPKAEALAAPPDASGSSPTPNFFGTIQPAGPKAEALAGGAPASDAPANDVGGGGAATAWGDPGTINPNTPKGRILAGGDGGDGVTTETNYASSDIDDMIEQYIGGSLEGPRDTSEDEALVSQAVLDQLGGQLVDQRARMGRAGFASSGAMAALEGDTMAAAERQAALDAMGIRDDARDEFNQNAQAAIGLSLDDAEASAQAARDNAVADAIRDLLGGDDDEPLPEDTDPLDEPAERAGAVAEAVAEGASDAIRNGGPGSPIYAANELYRLIFGLDEE